MKLILLSCIICLTTFPLFAQQITQGDTIIKTKKIIYLSDLLEIDTLSYTSFNIHSAPIPLQYKEGEKAYIKVFDKTFYISTLLKKSKQFMDYTFPAFIKEAYLIDFKDKKYVVIQAEETYFARARISIIWLIIDISNPTIIKHTYALYNYFYTIHCLNDFNKDGNIDILYYNDDNYSIGASCFSLQNGQLKIIQNKKISFLEEVSYYRSGKINKKETKWFFKIK